MDAGLGAALLVIAFAGAAMAYAGLLALLGKLPRAGYRAAGPALIFGGVAAFATALAFTPFAFAGKLETFVAIVVLMVTAGMVLGSVFSALMSALSAANSPTETADPAEKR